MAAQKWGCPSPEYFHDLPKDTRIDIIAWYEATWRIDVINSYEAQKEAERNAKRKRKKKR